MQGQGNKVIELDYFKYWLYDSDGAVILESIKYIL